MKAFTCEILSVHSCSIVCMDIVCESVYTCAVVCVISCNIATVIFGCEAVLKTLTLSL